MDRFRALQYFIAAAEDASFSGAARRYEVSTPAVAKLIGALERDLGAPLFERSTRGLTLTSGGQSYLESCRSAIALLTAADDEARGAASRSLGTVVVGVQHVLGRHCLTSALPRFHARHPEIRIDVHDFSRATDEQVRGIDIFLVLGWPEAGDLVRRRIGQPRYVVCAAPAHWAAHGMPRRPKDLEHHECLLSRSIRGTVMDLWAFRRGKEKETVAVGGWLVTSNAHRDIGVEAAIAGHGVVRMLDFSHRDCLRSRVLVPALADWESTDVPPVNLMYRPSCRRIPRVRTVIDFLAALFDDSAVAHQNEIAPSPRPAWSGRHFGRASALLARGRAKSAMSR